MDDNTGTQNDMSADAVEENADLGGREFDAAAPAVAEAGAKNMAVMAILGLAGAFALFIIFSGEEEEIKDTGDAVTITTETSSQDKVREPISVSRQPVAPPVTPIIEDIEPELQHIPIPPDVQLAPPPLSVAAPAIPGGVKSGTSRARSSSLSTQQIKERVKSPMFISGSGSGSAGSFTSGDITGGSAGLSASAVLGNSPAISVNATKTGDPYSIIGTGKVIDAVVETAIDSALPGLLRAIVSQNVYSEQGRNILIPKGSRLIGSYETEISRGQARIYITWDRVVRPDGIDIMLGSPSAGPLGKSGILGTLDNRYAEIFSNSFLLSTLTIGFAIAGDAVTGGGSVSAGETGSGDTTQSGDITSISMLNAVNDFGSTANDIAKDLVDLKPVITVDQGTRVKVFVNKDIKFPKDVAMGGIKFIQ